MSGSNANWDRQDIEVTLPDTVLLRGWLYQQASPGAPVIIMSHGFGAVKEMALDRFAEVFANGGFNVVVYDHRNLGSSEGLPRSHIDPWQQLSDCREVITYARNLPNVDSKRLGIWGTSFSGGHALVMGAVDRRIGAVVSQGATISGWRNSLRRFPGDMWYEMSRRFAEDRDAVANGQPPCVIPGNPDLTEADRNHPEDKDASPRNSSLAWARAIAPERLRTWTNKLTLQSLELYRAYEPGAFVARISPTPLLVIAATHDTVTPTDEILGAYNQALEPKRLALIPGGHFDLYTSQLTKAAGAALSFYREFL